MRMIEAETMTILMSEYVAMKKDAARFQALDTMGVDNWDGYQEAMDLVELWEREEEEEAGR